MSNLHTFVVVICECGNEVFIKIQGRKQDHGWNRGMCSQCKLSHNAKIELRDEDLKEIKTEIKPVVIERNHYQCFSENGNIGCSHNLGDKCDHECHTKSKKLQKELLSI